jgi:hypothetical protein
MGDSTDEIAEQLAATRGDAEEKIRSLTRRVERTTVALMPRAAGGALMAAGVAMGGAAVVLAVRTLRRPSLSDLVASRLSRARRRAAAMGRAARRGVPPVHVTVGHPEDRRPVIARQVALRLAQAAGAAAGTTAVRQITSRRQGARGAER